LTETAEFTGPAVFIPVSFVPIGPPGVTWSADPSLFLTSAGEIQTASQDATSRVTINNFSSAFDIDVIVANPDGAAVSTTETVQVTYGYSPSAVPEPVTAPLIGIGMIGIGLATRLARRTPRDGLPGSSFRRRLVWVGTPMPMSRGKFCISQHADTRTQYLFETKAGSRCWR
jgi:hypothetical protein